MKVYAYFENIAGFQHEDTIRLWEDTWRKFGWRPTVLGYEHVKSHPLAQYLDTAVRDFPTVNPTLYERACFRRWLAMVTVGGGLMTDYDVMCNGFTPGNLPTQDDPFTVFENITPCTVYGSERAFLHAVFHFIFYRPSEEDNHNGRPHVSDQCILRRKLIPFSSLMVGKQFGNEGWESSSLIHFNSESIPKGRQRAEVIRSSLTRLGIW